MKTIYCNGVAVAVSEAVYQAYWQETERARYGDRVAAAHCWQESALEAYGVPADSWQGDEASAEDVYFSAEKAQALSRALDSVDAESVEWLWRLVLGETTERALAAELGCPRATVHKRKKRLLAELRKHLDGEGRL